METKPALLSTTIQGAIVDAIAFMVVIFKLPIVEDEISYIVGGILGLIGVIMSIVGRIKAKKEISGII